MRDFLLGVAGVTLFGFLVLWSLTPLPHAPEKTADVRTSLPAPVATSPPSPPPSLRPSPPPSSRPSPPLPAPPPVAEKEPAPASIPLPSPAPVAPATVTSEISEARPPVADEPVQTPAAAPAPPHATRAAHVPSGSPRVRKTTGAQNLKPARGAATKPVIARPAQKPAPCAPREPWEETESAIIALSVEAPLFPC